MKHLLDNTSFQDRSTIVTYNLEISMTKHNQGLFPSHVGSALGDRSGSPHSHSGNQAFQQWFHHGISAPYQRMTWEKGASVEVGGLGTRSEVVHITSAPVLLVRTSDVAPPGCKDSG